MPTEALDPTVAPETEATGPIEDAAALCLSGGGYRAMLFHVGTLWRLNELAYLQKLRRILLDLRSRLRLLLLPERRPERSYPRVVKIKMSSYDKKWVTRPRRK